MLKRIIPLVVVMALVVPFLLFPASAAYDYNDFITNIEVDGDKDLVTITVPTDKIKLQLLCSEIGLNQVFYSNTFSWPLEASRYYSFYAYSFANDGYLDVTNIPNGTLVTFDVSVSSVQPAGYSSPSWATNIYYYDNRSLYIGHDWVSQGKDAIRDSFTFEATMNKVAGTSQASFNLVMMDLQPFSSSDFTFTIDSLYLTFSISSLYRLQEQTGKTNEILSAVEKKLEQNGQKLDDVISGIEDNGDKLDEIINGEVEPERPEGSDSIDDLGKLEEDLLGSAADGMEDYDIFIDDSLSFIENHVQGFALMSIVFDSFFGVGWLHGIFVISLSLGIFGYLVNIAFKAAGDAKSKGARAGKGGKGS